MYLTPVICIGDTPCPLFENDTIILQPANFLSLSQTYSTAATGYIRQMAGTYMYVCMCVCMYVCTV